MDLPVLILLLLLAVAYLIYKVHRLEMLLMSGARPRRQRVGPNGQRIIPILKEHIEPGPFRAGNGQAPSTPPDKEA